MMKETLQVVDEIEASGEITFNPKDKKTKYQTENEGIKGQTFYKNENIRMTPKKTFYNQT